MSDLSGPGDRVDAGVHPDRPDADLRGLAAWYLHGRSGLCSLVWRLPLTGAVAVLALLATAWGLVQNPRANLEESRRALSALKPPKVSDPENAALDYQAVPGLLAPFPGPGHLELFFGEREPPAGSPWEPVFRIPIGPAGGAPKSDK